MEGRKDGSKEDGRKEGTNEGREGWREGDKVDGKEGGYWRFHYVSWNLFSFLWNIIKIKL